MKKNYLVICAVIFFAMIYGANLFASDYDDCTFTPDYTGWKFPYDNIATRLTTGKNWLYTPYGKIDIQPTSQFFSSGYLRVTVNNSIVPIYSNEDLTDSIPYNRKYYSTSTGNITIYFWTGFDTTKTVELRSSSTWESWESWDINVSCP